MICRLSHKNTSIMGWLLSAVVVLAGCAGSSSYTPLQSPPGTATTFILVRHAEKLDSSAESPLSDTGRKRAVILADTLAPMGITAIYCPALTRNLETVQPLADRLGLEIHSIPGWQLLNTRRFARRFVEEAFTKHAGGTVVWAGNSSAVGNWGSNLQELYQILGGQGEGPRAYSDLFIITVGDDGFPHIQKRRYGESVP